MTDQTGKISINANSASNNGSEIKKLLAQEIGVEPEDINDDDSLVDDLHMSASDLSDFIHLLTNSGYELSTDVSEIETVNELVEATDTHE